MEWVSFIIVSAVPAIWCIITVIANIEASREDRRARSSSEGVTSPQKPPRPAISPALRAELDQTQGWWDEQFHKALTGVEQPVLYGDPEYYEERSITGMRAVHMVYQASALPNCTCDSCTTTRRSYD